MVDTAKLKAQFGKRLDALRARVSELEEDLRAPHDADSEERASEIEGDEVMEGLENSALQEIGHIETALKRIDAGTYGVCDACGERIDARRLEALPYATRCIDCAS